jgi:hypothetical protein
MVEFCSTVKSQRRGAKRSPAANRIPIAEALRIDFLMLSMRVLGALNMAQRSDSMINRTRRLHGTLEKMTDRMHANAVGGTIPEGPQRH